jgi:uncharacterized protein (TIGR02145 family)
MKSRIFLTISLLSLLLAGCKNDDENNTCSPQPETAVAGVDQTGLTTSWTSLNATCPTTDAGVWTMQSGTGGSITTPTSCTSVFNGQPGTSYVLRWTVSNSCGSTYDEVNISFSSANTVTDYDGNIYPTVTIGTQTWMKQNLRVTHTPAGAAVVASPPDSSAANVQEYGMLYTFEVATTVCPDGWHLPTDGEWNVLVNYLGGENVAGGKLKETGIVHWNTPNTGATNSSDFSAVGAGFKMLNNSYSSFKNNAYFWSSTTDGTITAWSRDVPYYNAYVLRESNNKGAGFSVRCVKD